MKLFTSSTLILIALFSIELQAQIQVKKSVFFDSNSSEMNVATYNILSSEYAQFTLHHELQKILIVGHTDGVGSEKFNMKLSERRAKTVKTALVKLGVESSIINYTYKGEQAPITSNATDKDKAKNRRVEIVYFGISKKETSTKLEQEQLLEVDKSDTTLVFPRGTELIMDKTAFAPYSIDEVDFEMTEALELGSIIQMNLQTRDTEGNCLESGGMIFTTSEVDGKTVDPNSPITVRILAKNYNPEFELYDMEVVDGDTLWTAMNRKPELSNDGYYTFEVRRTPNINLDCLGPVGLLANSLGLDIFKDRDIVVKTRGKKIKRSQLFGDNEIHNISGEQFKKRRSQFDVCSFNPEDYFFVTAVKKGELYYGLQQASNVKYKRLFNRYVFRKKHMQKTSQEEIKTLLNELELS